MAFSHATSTNTSTKSSPSWVTSSRSKKPQPPRASECVLGASLTSKAPGSTLCIFPMSRVISPFAGEGYTQFEAPFPSHLGASVLMPSIWSASQRSLTHDTPKTASCPPVWRVAFPAVVDSPQKAPNPKDFPPAGSHISFLIATEIVSPLRGPCAFRPQRVTESRCVGQLIRELGR